MNVEPNESTGEAPQRRIGGDLVLPAIGTAFALYYLYTIIGLPFVAQVNGLFDVSMVILLSLALVARTLLRARTGGASLSIMPLFEPIDANFRRAALLLLLVGFWLVFPIFGFTLTTASFLVLALFVVGERSITKILTTAVVASLVGYCMFFLLLPTQFPKGPFENLIDRLF
jgi:hypothetical protein